LVGKARGRYSNRAGLDAELAQIEQRYRVDTHDGYLPSISHGVLFEVYARYQLDRQDSEPVAVCQTRVRIVVTE